MANPNESDWGSLIDDREISRRREAAEVKYRDLGSDKISYLRRRAKSDLFFLASGPLQYDLLTPKLHGHLCKWMKATQEEQYRLILLPRGHYKSTLITIAESIQMALPNEAEVQAHPYNLGPNIKLLIGHENRESASRFLYEIVEAFTAKPLMLALFPELIPTKRRQRMNKWELDLPRESHSKEPTFDTIGAGGAAQGRHYNWLKLDDLIGEDARESETIMRRTLDWFDNVNSLLTRLSVDGWDLIGTRWAATDVYSHALRMYGVDKSVSILNSFFEEDVEKLDPGVLAAYSRGAVENDAPIFPEEFTMDKLERLRKNPKVWAAQYANNPRESSLTEFEDSWLRFYNVGGNGQLYVFDGESSRSLGLADLDICLLIDPSMGESEGSDEAGFVVTGTDDKLNIYILEAFRKRLKPPELLDEMFRLYHQYNPRIVSIEDVAFQMVFGYWFQEKCQEMGIYPSIHRHQRSGTRKKKDTYIRGLTNYFAAGQVYILEGMHQLRDEFEWFPLGDSKHILDALSQGPEVWAPGLSQDEYRDFGQVVDRIIDNRDAVTGY